MRFWTSESQTLVNFCAHCSFSIRDLDHGKVVERSCFKQFLFFFQSNCKGCGLSNSNSNSSSSDNNTNRAAGKIPQQTQPKFKIQSLQRPAETRLVLTVFTEHIQRFNQSKNDNLLSIVLSIRNTSDIIIIVILSSLLTFALGN